MGGREGDESLLGARLHVPEHVVYRDFGEETVMLNLQTGMYHGLNQTAALMVSRLGESDTVAAAIDRLVDEIGQPREVIHRDVLGLCDALAERGLIEQVEGDAG
jgi:hypothetical protein